jgi:hypothetical protein
MVPPLNRYRFFERGVVNRHAMAVVIEGGIQS